MAMLTTESNGKQKIDKFDGMDFSKTSRKRVKPGKTGKKSGFTP